MKTIDAFLNGITMYRLVLLSLWFLAVVSLVLAFFRVLPFTALQLSVSLLVLVFTAWLSNKVLALFARAAPTPESSVVTGLILFFIFAPVHSIGNALVLAGFACIAMASKYILAYKRKHIFNPAAVAALIASVLGGGLATWWVGMPLLLPFVALIGFLIVRKLRRFDLVLTFLLVASVVFAVRVLLSGTSLTLGLEQFLLSWPLIFFATVMLTEPQTTPPQGSDRLIYATIVGLFFSLAFKIGPVSATPELALFVGNIFSYAVSFRNRIVLTLKEVVPLTRDIFEFVFLPNTAFTFEPGQYAEWTLSHRSSDKRGVRRFFTIASAPEDPFVRVGMRVPVEGSTFKSRLHTLTPGSRISMTGVAGGFTLPEDPNEKIAAIAGGIGITPFMSMFRHLAERHEHRDITLIYSATSPLDFAYKEELEEIAPSIGLTIVYLPTDYTELTSWEGKSGYLSEAIIREDISDFADRTWYLSGPNAMVTSYKELIQSLGVSRLRIRTDYFPGL